MHDTSRAANSSLSHHEDWKLLKQSTWSEAHRQSDTSNSELEKRFLGYCIRPAAHQAHLASLSLKVCFLVWHSELKALLLAAAVLLSCAMLGKAMGHKADCIYKIQNSWCRDVIAVAKIWAPSIVFWPQRRSPPPTSACIDNGMPCDTQVMCIPVEILQQLVTICDQASDRKVKPIRTWIHLTSQNMTSGWSLQGIVIKVMGPALIPGHLVGVWW